MKLEDFLSSARRAIGGLDRIAGVRSYEAESRRVFADGSEATVTVRRRAGGYVQIRERTERKDTVRATAGGAALSQAELAELQRGARIAPRNLLAHAHERGVVIPEDAPAEGEILLAYPDESVVYAFDASTCLCRRLEDRARDLAIAYADYREVSGIATPFLESHTRLDGTPLFREEFVRVEYGIEGPEVGGR